MSGLQLLAVPGLSVLLCVHSSTLLLAKTLIRLKNLAQGQPMEGWNYSEPTYVQQSSKNWSSQVSSQVSVQFQLDSDHLLQEPSQPRGPRPPPPALHPPKLITAPGLTDHCPMDHYSIHQRSLDTKQRLSGPCTRCVQGVWVVSSAATVRMLGLVSAELPRAGSLPGTHPGLLTDEGSSLKYVPAVMIMHKTLKGKIFAVKLAVMFKLA